MSSSCRKIAEDGQLEEWGRQKRISKRLNKIEYLLNYDAQLVQFWHLQLQFMQMSAFELKTVNYAFWSAEMPNKIKNQHIFWKDFTEEQRMEYATEMALKLSGLDQ